MVTYRCPNCFTEYPEGTEFCPKCSSSNPHPVFLAYEAHEPHVESGAKIEAEIDRAGVREKIREIVEKMLAEMGE